MVAGPLVSPHTAGSRYFLIATARCLGETCEEVGFKLAYVMSNFVYRHIDHIDPYY